MYDRAFTAVDDLPDIPVPPTQERILDPLPTVIAPFKPPVFPSFVTPAKTIPLVKEVEESSNSSDDDKPHVKPSPHAEAETASEKSEEKPITARPIVVMKRTEVLNREKKLKERESAISKREYDLSQRENAVSQRESAISQREAELPKREDMLIQKERALTLREELICQRRDSYRKWFESIKSEQEGLVVKKQTLFKLMATLHSDLGKTTSAVASLEAPRSSVSEPVYPEPTTDVPNQRKEKRDETKESISKKAKQ